MADWAVQRFESSGDGPRLGVKDIIDVQGTINSAGCKVLAAQASVAKDDAPIVARARAAGASVVAKTVLVELAYGAQGINPFYGTPENPISKELIPGGSSSGSAVGVAMGELDVAYGTDTGGSVRIPAACCGIYGLKTTHGRVSTDGVIALANSLDTVGPLGAQPSVLSLAMTWLDPTYSEAEEIPHGSALRVRTSDSPLIESSIDAALNAAGLMVSEWESGGGRLRDIWQTASAVMGYEAWKNDSKYLRERHRMDPKVVERLMSGSTVTGEKYEESIELGQSFRSEVLGLIGENGVLALASIPFEIPDLSRAYSRWLNVNTIPFNLAGLPAISVPIPVRFIEGVLGNLWSGSEVGQGIGRNGVRVPVSLQLVGVPNSEERLIATAQLIHNSLR